MTNINPGKLIFISDLEGCASFTMDFKTPQSAQICSKDFFDKLDLFMGSNSNNKIAFLGDYFDKGNEYESTIERIIGLYDKYNKGVNTKINSNSLKKRVYIILGNRDINKLRLLFELKDIIKKDNKNIVPNNNKLWGLWKNFYINYFKSTNLFEKFKIILEDSMGAMPLIEKIKINDYYKKLFEYFMIVLYSNKNNENENNNDKRIRKSFLKLFTYGRIVDYDSDFKVLLSHAGGLGNFLFHTQQYYDNIKEKLKIKRNNIQDMISYFENIEIARRELTKPPNDENTIFNLSSNNNKNANLINIKKIISILNSPLINFMKNQSMDNPDFYLLQALGLKPDNAATDYFVSFVQSCDCIFCKGPRARNMYTIKDNNTVKKNIYDKNIYLQFLSDLKKLNVKFVAFGHNPHCAPVPIIYKRSDDIGKIRSSKSVSEEASLSPVEDKIIFIGNDVSNGFRSANIDEIYKIPLAYISKNPDEVGVGFLDKDNTNISPPRANSNLIAESLKQFKSMINKWEYNKVPEFDLGSKTIKYNSTTLSFPAREPRMVYNVAVMK
jgi:hypothetical protein